MKAKNLLVVVLFMTMTVLFSGCGKTDTKLQAENADLKARLQKLEQQLQASKSQTASQASSTASQASLQDLKSQLDEAQKKADDAATETKSLTAQVEAQKAKIDQLTRDLAAAQAARQKAEQALQLYRDNAASALKQFQALRSTLGGETPKLDDYHQNYVATQTAVTKLLAAMPQSKVRRQIVAALAVFTQMNDTWVTADLQIQQRAKQAQADYDKFVDFGGLGPNDYVVNLGKTRILAPAEQENAETAARRDKIIASSVKDADAAIKSLQTILNA
ncbi:MAG TPA: hypothetical protein VMB80_16675 [Candidatus Acidoferrum sp.]|nr:hypothetical protein [Candidatus Acidoferrum sp.]